MVNKSYPNIDMERTGLLLKYKIQQEGYTVKDIQKKLSLSCPQPIYRWYQGKVLPSVNHLYVLSDLLNVHMEELLVPQTEYWLIPEAAEAISNLFVIFKKPHIAAEMDYLVLWNGERQNFVAKVFLNDEKRMLEYLENIYAA